MKVDVSVQSYNKPESLIYALFKLHRVSKDRVDTVWINDDQSKPGVVEKYKRLEQSGVLAPWKIKVRVNTQRMGWWLAFVKGKRPSYQTNFFRLKRMLWNLWKTKTIYVAEEDIRYQWALNSTDKDYLFVMHDDIFFEKDVIGLYLDSALSPLDDKKCPKVIVGELGQCWRCPFKSDGCEPEKVLAGELPSKSWPLSPTLGAKNKWSCRINEWSALLSVKGAREIQLNESLYFGNFDNNGDTAAYWFSRAVAMGYGFDDPLPKKELRDSFYLHWENGVTGHSAWVDQGAGKNSYSPEVFAQRVLDEFEYSV